MLEFFTLFWRYKRQVEYVDMKLSAEQVAGCRAVKRLIDLEKSRSGLTQETLAGMIGKSPKLVSAIVTERTPVTVPVGRKLSKIFDVPLSEFLPWVADVPEPSTRPGYSRVIEDLEDLSPENRKVALRMIRNLLESQAGS